MERELDPMNLRMDEDWEGNNIALTCPGCGNVFIVSQLIHAAGRACPACGQYEGWVKGGRLSGGKAGMRSRAKGDGTP